MKSRILGIKLLLSLLFSLYPSDYLVFKLSIQVIKKLPIGM